MGGRPVQLGEGGGIWGVGASPRFGLGCQTFPLASEPGAMMTPPCRDAAGAAVGKETSGNFAECEGTGIPTDTREKHPGSEGVGEPGMPRCRGAAQEDWGGISVFKTLGFPSSAQELQWDCQEQTGFVSRAALRPRGWAEGSSQQLLAAPSKPSSSKRASFPVLMPSCSLGRPSPAGTACFFPWVLPAASPTPSKKGGLGLRGGPCVHPSSQRKEPPHFSGTFQSFLLPHSHFGTEKPPPIATLRPSAPGRGSAGCWRDFRSVSPRWDGARARWWPGAPEPSPSLDLALVGGAQGNTTAGPHAVGGG